MKSDIRSVKRGALSMTCLEGMGLGMYMTALSRGEIGIRKLNPTNISNQLVRALVECHQRILNEQHHERDIESIKTVYLSWSRELNVDEPVTISLPDLWQWMRGVYEHTSEYTQARDEYYQILRDGLHLYCETKNNHNLLEIKTDAEKLRNRLNAVIETLSYPEGTVKEYASTERHRKAVTV